MDENDKQLNEQISAYLDGEMTLDERLDFEQRMADSDELAEKITDYQELKRMLKDLPEPELPEDLHGRIMSSVRGEVLTVSKAAARRKVESSTPWQPYAKRVGTVAASILLAVFVIGGASWMLGGLTSSTTTDSSSSDTVEDNASPSQQEMSLDSAAGTTDDMDEEESEDSGLEYFSDDESVTSDDVTANDSDLRTDGDIVLGEGLSIAVTEKNMQEYYISIEVEDMEQAVAALAEMEGYDKYADIYYDEDYASASIERAVDSGVSEDVLANISALGEVTSQSQSQSSMLNDYNDAQAGYEAKQEEYLHLLEILELTTSYDEVTTVMNYLDDCVAAMENYQSTMRQIESDTATQVIYITLEQKSAETITVQDSLGERVAAAFQSSVAGVVSTGQALVLIGAWLIVPLAALAVIAGIVLVIYRKRKKGGERHE